MKKYENDNRKLRNLLPSIYFIILFVLFSIGYFSYRTQINILVDSKKNELSKICDSKIQIIEIWKKDRINDASIYFNNHIFSSIFNEYLLSSNENFKSKILNNIKYFIQNYSEYEDVSFIAVNEKKNIFLNNNGVLENGLSTSEAKYFGYSEQTKQVKVTQKDEEVNVDL